MRHMCMCTMSMWMSYCAFWVRVEFGSELSLKSFRVELSGHLYGVHIHVIDAEPTNQKPHQKQTRQTSARYYGNFGLINSSLIYNYVAEFPTYPEHNVMCVHSMPKMLWPRGGMSIFIAVEERVENLLDSQLDAFPRRCHAWWKPFFAYHRRVEYFLQHICILMMC